MTSLPPCREPLYEEGSGPRVVISVAGSPSSLERLGPLPAISNHVQWVREPLPCASNDIVDLTFVLWEEERRLEIADFLAHRRPGLGSIVVHDRAENVPDIIGELRLIRFFYTETPALDIALAVRMLAFPLLYRSEVCVAYEDLAFMLQRSGHITLWGPLPAGDAHLPLKLQELACGPCTYSLVLLPESDAKNLWPTVEQLSAINGNFAIVAAHLHAGEEAAVWVMTIDS